MSVSWLCEELHSNHVSLLKKAMHWHVMISQQESSTQQVQMIKLSMVNDGEHVTLRQSAWEKNASPSLQEKQ